MPLVEDEGTFLFSNLAAAARRAVESEVSRFVDVLSTTESRQGATA